MEVGLPAGAAASHNSTETIEKIKGLLYTTTYGHEDRFLFTANPKLKKGNQYDPQRLTIKSPREGKESSQAESAETQLHSISPQSRF